MNIVDRFLAYTRINTTTSRENGAAGIMPSSPGQRVLAELLKSELEALGLCDILLNERAILTATLPANTDKSLPVVSFLPTLIPVPSKRRIPRRTSFITPVATSP